MVGLKLNQVSKKGLYYWKLRRQLEASENCGEAVGAESARSHTDLKNARQLATIETIQNVQGVNKHCDTATSGDMYISQTNCVFLFVFVIDYFWLW